MFSKAAEYALKAMIYLCSVEESGGLAGLKEIAAAIDSPEAYTAKILQKLVQADLLQSLRGPTGGFRISKNPIALAQVVIAIQGDRLVTGCVLGLNECSGDHPCPVHDKFVAIRDHLKGVLTTTFLSELKDGVMNGNRYLKV